MVRALVSPLFEPCRRLNVGVAFVAGLCIVLMAIMLDRRTVAASERSEARGTSTEDGNKRRKLILGVTGGVTAVIVYISNS